MRILIEATPNYLNMGDLAMLQVCVRRLRGLWPAAQLAAFTVDNERLQEVCPGVSGVPAVARTIWFRQYRRFGHLSRFISERHRTSAALVNARIHMCMPALWEGRLSPHLPHGPYQRDVLFAFLDTLRSIDLFVISGMGSFHDVGGQSAVDMLETISLMKSLRVPSVAFSQGIGPLERSSIEWAAARRCLRHLEFIALRERLASPKLLRDLGVHSDRATVTGDDAIACAYRESQHSGSHSLGVSLRVTSYSGVTDAHAQRLSRLLCALAAGVGAELVAVPISHVPGESDLEAFVRMFPGRNTPALSPAFRMTPEWIRDEIGRCRVVITGAYHTAVFALSQGIPAVCLANSQYYLDKFLGLAAQFEQGCQVIRLDAPDSEAAIKRATEDVWHKCDLYRKPLLSAALKQIRESERAWANLPSVLSQRGCIQRVCSRQPQDSKSSETG